MEILYTSSFIYLFFFTRMNIEVDTMSIETPSMKKLASHVPEFYMANIGNFTCEGFVSRLD